MSSQFYGPGVYLLTIAPSIVTGGVSIMAAKCESIQAARDEAAIGEALDRVTGDYAEHEIVEVETLAELKAKAAEIRARQPVTN